jgi:large subunit ribosomal protein L25
MSEIVTFAAERRQPRGKGGAREARRAGRVPAIIYGRDQEPMAISVDLVALDKQLHTHGFFARVFEIDVEGRKLRALVRECQRDPVIGRPLHVDFLSVSAATMVDVDVDVLFENEDKSPGIRNGGVLNIVLHQIPLRCQADQIPPSVKIDLSGLEIGDVIHLNEVALPAGTEVSAADAEATVASIAAPSVPVSEEIVEPSEVPVVDKRGPGEE